MVKRIRVCFACRAKDEKYGVYHGNEKINNNFEKSLHQEILGKFLAENIYWTVGYYYGCFCGHSQQLLLRLNSQLSYLNYMYI